MFLEWDSRIVHAVIYYTLLSKKYLSSYVCLWNTLGDWWMSKYSKWQLIIIFIIYTFSDYKKYKKMCLTVFGLHEMHCILNSWLALKILSLLFFFYVCLCFTWSKPCCGETSARLSRLLLSQLKLRSLLVGHGSPGDLFDPDALAELSR